MGLASTSIQFTSIEVDNKATHQTTHPTGKVVKWNKTSNTSIEDFKYFNWRGQILAKLSLNSSLTPAQPQLNSISTQIKAEVSLILRQIQPPTQPASQPPTQSSSERRQC